MTGLVFVQPSEKTVWKIENIAFILSLFEKSLRLFLYFVCQECQQEITVNKMKYLVVSCFTNIIYSVYYWCSWFLFFIIIQNEQNAKTSKIEQFLFK